jgi:hypothetical protein
MASSQYTDTFSHHDQDNSIYDPSYLIRPAIAIAISSVHGCKISPLALACYRACTVKLSCYLSFHFKPGAGPIAKKQSQSEHGRYQFRALYIRPLVAVQILLACSRDFQVLSKFRSLKVYLNQMHIHGTTSLVVGNIGGADRGLNW